MSRYTFQAYQELMRNKNLEDPTKERENNLASFFGEINKPSLDDNPIGYQQVAELDNQIQKDIAPVKTITSCSLPWLNPSASKSNILFLLIT